MSENRDRFGSVGHGLDDPLSNAVAVRLIDDDVPSDRRCVCDERGTPPFAPTGTPAQKYRLSPVGPSGELSLAKQNLSFAGDGVPFAQAWRWNAALECKA